MQLFTSSIGNAANFAVDLLETFMYPMERGQIRSEAEQAQTVELNTKRKDGEELSLFDFATPAIDNKRGASKEEEIKNYFIHEAYTKVLAKLRGA